MVKKGMTPDQFKQKIDPSPEYRALKVENESLKKRLSNYKIEHGTVERFFSEVLEAVSVIKPIARKYTPPKAKGTKHSTVLHLTDWHIGEVVDPSEIENFNSFNPEIARDRVIMLCEKIIDWISLHRHNYVIDELVIIVTGDMIAGDIHMELMRTNAFPPPVQACEAGSLLAEAVAMLAPHYKKVRVEFIVPDNHSRLTQRVQFKEAGLNSYNYIVGFIAKEQLNKHKNIEFNLHTQVEKVVEVQGFRYLCFHGHQIKGWAGFPYYGIDRKAGKEARARMNRTRDKHFHKMLIGHYHAPLRHPDWLIGGSLSGTTEFDHAAGRDSSPCQTAWLMHPKFGEREYNEFILTER